MDQLDLEYVKAARSQVKACMNVCRATLRVLADMDERLESALNPQPEEAQGDDEQHPDRHERAREAGRAAVEQHGESLRILARS